jgi:hypothetical protein
MAYFVQKSKVYCFLIGAVFSKENNSATGGFGSTALLQYK